MSARRTTRLAAATLLLISAGATLLGLAAASAEEQTITSMPITTFMGAGIGERVQGVVWRGGIEMQSQSDTFGGLSGLGFTGPDNRLVMVSDRGNFVSGRLLYDEAQRPVGLIGVTIEPIQNSRGNELPRAYTRDAEALTVIVRDGQPSAIRVGFENLTRVADFTLVDGKPSGAAREVTIPSWLTDTRTNQTLEAVCIAPDASPVAGSTVLITEGIMTEEGRHSGFLLGNRDRGPISYRAGGGMNPTDCAFLPNGDLLVLERGISLFAFRMRLVRIAAADVKPDARMEGELLLESSGSNIDNMEALAVHTAPDGSERITIVSDNNFNDWERNLLLEFSLE